MTATLCAMAAGARWKSHSPSQRLAFWIMCFLAISNTYFFIFQIPSFQRAHRLDWTLTTMASFIPAMVYSYICRLTGSGTHKKLMGGYAMPAVVAFINLVLYMLMGDKDAQEYLYHVIINGRLNFKDYPVIWLVKRFAASYLFRIVLFSQAVFILLMSFRNVSRFHRELEDFYTASEMHNFLGTNIIRFSLMFLMMALGLLCAFPYSLYSENAQFMLIMGVLISIGDVLLTIYAMKQSVSADKLRLLEEETSNLRLGLKTSDSLKSRLESAIGEEFYTNPEVSIMSLADQLGTNREYLSEYIHLTYGLSFSNFVNDLRIKKAVAEMRGIPENMPLTRVAEHCGYKSYASFARDFVIFAHCTPSEWMKRFR